jgi:hypothetical protein
MSSIMKRFVLAVGLAGLGQGLPVLAASSPPPPAIQPMAAPLETTDWVLANDVRGFEDGRLLFCAESKRRIFFRECLAKGSMTPAEALAKLGPPGAQLTGFAPRFTGYGQFHGMILYYRRAQPKS